ncbi:MFS general substrate transporter [Armillaria gallica]|uniref:MFS general substrate transporter n=1 Tax=Armillaria gallica TaxID=47427 RepID=A0A2H3EJ24_ARMGA|nr:MFS general substrate transporter [Armillaria gallica]
MTSPVLPYQSNGAGKAAWYSYAWDSFGKPQEERNFIVKLDLSLLVFSVLGLLMRYIDQKNVDSAYVSGMREELNLYGNELNYAQTCWTVGYVIGQVPVNMLLNRISPHYIIFALEMGWTLLTLCTTWAHNATHLYVIRFFVGLFESGYYPGLLFLIGSWYTKDELAKRSNIFQAATAGGTLLCGLIQGGIYSSLNGKGGYSGWRWCFAIDALISFPIAVGAFFMIPDLPTVIKPNWLFSERDIEIGKARMLAAGREGPKPGSFDFPFFVNLLSEWHIWLFTAGYSLYIYSQNPQQSMSFWLKYSKNPTYTVPQINYYPSGIWATQIVSALGFSWLSDTVLKGRRWPPLIFVTVWHLIDVAVLAATPVYAENRAPRWVFYYLSGLVNCTPGLFYAWCSEIAGASSEKRGVIMGTFNSVAYSFNAWLPLLLFKTTEQPRVLKGNISVVVAQVLLIGVLLAILHLSKRDQRREAKKAQDD